MKRTKLVDRIPSNEYESIEKILSCIELGTENYHDEWLENDHGVKRSNFVSSKGLEG